MLHNGHAGVPLDTLYDHCGGELLPHHRAVRNETRDDISNAELVAENQDSFEDVTLSIYQPVKSRDIVPATWRYALLAGKTKTHAETAQ